jgi:hypothetical protein
VPVAAQPVAAQPAEHAAVWSGERVAIEVSLDQGEQAILRELCRVTGLSTGDVLRQALRREHAAQIGAPDLQQD